MDLSRKQIEELLKCPGLELEDGSFMGRTYNSKDLYIHQALRARLEAIEQTYSLARTPALFFIVILFVIES